MSRRRKHRIKLRSLYVWHRYTGLTVAILTAVLAVTGIALNHTERLGLDSRYVQNDFILDWYGIEVPEVIKSYAVDSARITLFGRHLYLDTKELPGDHEQLTGAANSGDFIIIAVDNRILLLTHDGELVERLGGKEGVPPGMQAIGVDTTGAIVIDSALAIFQPDDDFLEWSEWDGDASRIHWLQPQPLPTELKTELIEHYRGEVLPWERVMLDLHSGRIIGSWGIWVMDAAAALLIVLAFTGVWMWLKRRR